MSTPPPLPRQHEDDVPAGGDGAAPTPAARTSAAQPPAGRTTPAPPAAPRGEVRRRTLREAAYLVCDLPVVILAFTAAMVGIAGSSALITAPLFIPLVGIWLRVLAGTERRLQHGFLGTDFPEPVYATDFPSTGSTAGDIWRRVTDPQTWLEIVWGVVGFVVGLTTWVLTVSFGAAAVAGLTSPLWFPLVHALPGQSGLSELLLGQDSFWFDLMVNLLGGVVGLVMFVVVAKVGSALQSNLFAALLGSRGSAGRYAALQSAHSAGQEAELESMRRLERDLHDGPQQGLVRLQMDLARAERLMETDPDKARQILASAGLTTSQTLGELRGLSRGIAPPLLVDRGLGAAVQELAGSHPARVTVYDQIGGRLPEKAETALYFAVSEALANVAKHAGARSVDVTLRRGPGTAEAVIADDGAGGASVAKGHGLAGLQRRLAGVHGTLEVHSPVGGPTVITARVPVDAR